MLAATDVTLADVEPRTSSSWCARRRTVFDRVMAQVRPVVTRITAIEQNRERLASLGTMAAGLAHELNNPAAAARRAAADLADALDVLGSTIGHFVESGIERAQAQELVELQREALARAGRDDPLDALDAADAEDELLAGAGGARRGGGVEAVRAARRRPASTPRGSRASRRARRAGDRRSAALGGRVAHGARASPASSPSPPSG